MVTVVWLVSTTHFPILICVLILFSVFDVLFVLDLPKENRRRAGAGGSSPRVDWLAFTLAEKKSRRRQRRR
jgi:hypothetical protein